MWRSAAGRAGTGGVGVEAGGPRGIVMTQRVTINDVTWSGTAPNNDANGTCKSRSRVVTRGGRGS